MPTDTYQSYTRDSGFGPTNTKTATKRFEQRLRGVLERINAAIRKAIVEEDLFNLRVDTLAVDDPGPFEESSDMATMAKFTQWLREQLNTEFLTVVSAAENQYIRRTYAEGMRLATRQLQNQDVDLQTVDIQELVEKDRFDTGLRTLFRRNFRQLESVKEDMVDDIRGTLLEGFRDGWNPSKMARKITDRVDSIGKNRATMIARSETINAHSQGFLDRTEQVQEELDIPMGVRHVGRVTAADEDVCAFCRRTSDSVFTIEEFGGTTVQWRGQIWRVAPPSHPNGRCSIQVELGEQDLPPLEERVPGNVIT